MTKTSTSQVVVSIKNVTKRIGHRIILERISLEIPAAQIYGISGPNGAGKSMLLRVMSGLVRPSEGEAVVFGEKIGHDIEFPQHTGILIERPGFLPNYSGMKNLELLALIRNQITKEEIISTLRLVGLDPYDTRLVKTFSTGMLQRLGIAQAIMEKPRLLLLDEPTNGLDLEGIKDVHRLLKELRFDGVTILLTSHSRQEIDELCDAEFLLENGRLSSIHILPNHS